MTLDEAIELLRRALPELKWAEMAADSEWSATLDDPEIVADVEKALAAHDAGAGPTP